MAHRTNTKLDGVLNGMLAETGRKAPSITFHAMTPLVRVIAPLLDSGAGRRSRHGSWAKCRFPVLLQPRLCVGRFMRHLPVYG